MTGGRVEESITEGGTGGGPGKERGQGSAPFSSALFMLRVQELIWGGGVVWMPWGPGVEEGVGGGD